MKVWHPDDCAVHYRGGCCDCTLADDLRDRMRCLGANLAVAGALCRAFALGDRWGFWTADPYGAEPPWRPNAAGRPAP